MLTVNVYSAYVVRCIHRQTTYTRHLGESNRRAAGSGVRGGEGGFSPSNRCLAIYKHEVVVLFFHIHECCCCCCMKTVALQLCFPSHMCSSLVIRTYKRGRWGDCSSLSLSLPGSPQQQQRRRNVWPYSVGCVCIPFLYSLPIWWVQFPQLNFLSSVVVWFRGEGGTLAPAAPVGWVTFARHHQYLVKLLGEIGDI